MNHEVSPFDNDAEKHVLGSILQDPDALLLVLPVLGEQPSVFHKAAHRVIYGAMLRLLAAADPIDLFTVTNDLKTHDELSRVGSVSYLYEIQESVPTAANVVFYAEIVAEKAVRRALIQAGKDVTARAGRDELELAEVLEQSRRLMEKASEQASDRAVVWATDLFDSALSEVKQLGAEGRELRGIPTGFPELDTRINGFCNGRFHILAARSKEGKSALAQNFALRVAATEGKPVLFVTLEMPPSEVARRILASQSRVDGIRLDSGRVDADGWRRLDEDTDALRGIPFGMTTQGTPSGIRAAVAAAQAKHGALGLLVVDYLQLMRGAQRTTTRENEISEYSRFLKELSLEKNIPILALAQVRRDVDGRGDRRPTAADLRESGAMEQDADVVLLIWRHLRNTDPQEQVTLIVERVRNGNPGECLLDWSKPYFHYAPAIKPTTDYERF